MSAISSTVRAVSPALPNKLMDFIRGEFEDTCRRRFFYALAFEPYGGTAGLYDLGPTMCAMKTNMLSYWRQHFVLEESMCEVECTCLTPEEVFKVSGHVSRFNDVMVRDTMTGECIRADKRLEEWAETQLQAGAELSTSQKEKLLHILHSAGGMNADEIHNCITDNKILSLKGNSLSEPFPFNLMFSTKMGPEGDRVGYYRPELAQGIILNFKRLMDSGNAQRFPFAAASIGNAFRNEIAPRAALIRVREFTLAEIEHFLDPNDKTHPKFSQVKEVEIWAWPRELQATNAEPIRLTIGDAVERKTIDNEALGYFIGRVALFLQHLGVKYFRFRQHLQTEMAHYAQDCWDAELLSSYGWIECVGIADRSAYDLTMHSKGSKKDLSAREDFAEPRMEEQLQRKLSKPIIGKTFGKQAKEIMDYLNELSDAECEAMAKKLKVDKSAPIILPSSKNVEPVMITSEMIQFEKKEVKVTGRSFVPSVIEPSFGVGRILYCLLEQSYWVRRSTNSGADSKNEKRAVFSLTPMMAPQKLAILPLMVKPELMVNVRSIEEMVLKAGISARVDNSMASIGKKYARMDELGIPFAVTCDYAEDGTVTLRERDSTEQVRVPKSELLTVLTELLHPLTPLLWSSILESYPRQNTEAA